MPDVPGKAEAMSDDRAPIDLDALEHDMDMQGADMQSTSEGDLYCLPVRDVLDLIAECRRLRAVIERVRAVRRAGNCRI